MENQEDKLVPLRTLQESLYTLLELSLELSLNTITKCIVRPHDSEADASCLIIALSIVLTDALVIAADASPYLLSKT